MEHSSQNSLEIEITSNDLSAIELEEIIRKDLDISNLGIYFSLKSKLKGFRSIDPTILVAIIGSSGVALAALISGLFNIAKERKSQKIVIQGKDGASLEIPVDTPPEKISELVKQLRYMDRPRIIF